MRLGRALIVGVAAAGLLTFASPADAQRHGGGGWGWHGRPGWGWPGRVSFVVGFPYWGWGYPYGYAPYGYGYPGYPPAPYYSYGPQQIYNGRVVTNSSGK